jgi:hypothetical protein
MSLRFDTEVVVAAYEYLTGKMASLVLRILISMASGDCPT